MSEEVATSGALALQVLHQQATVFAEHAPQVGNPCDPEHVHQTRVATRRMRAALRVFKDILPPELEELDNELRWIARQLGQVRDLDVQLLRLQSNATELDAALQLAPFRGWLEQRRKHGLDSLENAFLTIRFGALTERLQKLDDLQLDPTGDPPVNSDAPARIEAAYRRLRKVGQKLQADSPSIAFHKARIRAKRLRYTTEFFESVYDKPARRMIARVTELQDLLGAHQDSVVSGRHIQEAVLTNGTDWPTETALAIGRLVQWESQHQLELRQGFKPTYRAVQGAWKRLRRAL